MTQEELCALIKGDVNKTPRNQKNSRHMRKWQNGADEFSRDEPVKRDLESAMLFGTELLKALRVSQGSLSSG